MIALLVLRPHQKRGSRFGEPLLAFYLLRLPCPRAGEISRAKTRRWLVFADAPDENGERRSEPASEHRDPEGYFVCEKDLAAFERFDATFPQKEKQTLPGQLFS